MLRRTTSWNSDSTECNEKERAPKRGALLAAAVLLLLISGKLNEACSQSRTACDSLEAAWNHYFNNRFDRALALVADCDEPRALELRVFLALKENRNELAEAFMCKLLKRAPEYQPDPMQLPILGYVAWVKEMRKKCKSETPKAPVIRSQTEVLDWLEVNLGAGTFTLPDDDDNNPELFHARFGFDYAEFEAGTIPVMTLPLKKSRRTQLPVSVLKVRFPLNDIRVPASDLILIGYFSHNLPGWAREQEDQGLTYSKKAVHFALLLAKAIGPARISAGPTYGVLEVKRFAASDTMTAHEGKWSLHAELQAMLLPKRLLLVASAAPMPTYSLELKDKMLQKPYTKFLLTYGVRAFLGHNLSVDMGGAWRGYSKAELGEAAKHFFRFGATLGFSFAKKFP